MSNFKNTVPSTFFKQKIGCDSDGFSRVYICRKETADINTRKIISMMGGIKSIIGRKDIVLIKPNAQWWNQGMTNTDSIKAFIELVLQIPGFEGEIIISENHHFPDDDSRGWTTEYRNGSFNYNELIESFNSKGYSNVTKCHWHDGGLSKQPSWGGAEKGGVVEGPWEDNGYVWRKDIEYVAPTGRKALMSYPVFTSSYSGIRIDFKNGPWKAGRYLDTPVKLINYACLNHHSETGITASIKNYLGIVDMTCGHRGLEPKGYYNFHYVGFSNMPKIFKHILRHFGWCDTGEYIGGAVGSFMQTIRMADLNIITAELVGWGDRTDLTKSIRAQTVLASKDPVALDYIASRNVLLPTTRKSFDSIHFRAWNDPDDSKKPFFKFLRECHKQNIGNLDVKKIILIEHEFDH